MYCAETIQVDLMSGLRQRPILDPPPLWMQGRFDVPGQDLALFDSIDWSDITSINRLFLACRAPRALVDPRIAPQEAVGPTAEVLWPITSCATRPIPTNTEWTPNREIFAAPLNF